MRLSHWLILLTLTFTALGTHLWRLGEPARLMGDEWYFVQDAQRYADQRPYYDIHPPLGKLKIAAAITLLGDNPYNWRVVNAFSGALLILVAAWVVWLLTNHPRAAVLAAALVWLDGFVLTESRTGMINLPYVLYALAAVGCILSARRSTRPRQWLMLAGLAIGLALSVKWLAGLIIVPALLLWFWPKIFGWAQVNTFSNREALGWLIGLPLAVYLLVFGVHFWWIGSGFEIIKSHAVMLANSFGSDQTGHPYRDIWWRWPLLWQPFPYWSELRGGQLSTVWSMPNPALWWASWLVFFGSLLKGWRQPTIRAILIFTLFSWLPFMLIRRDMFLYHALPLSIWLSILLAVAMHRLWDRYRIWVLVGWLAFVISFAWWWPWYMNQPLSANGHQGRAWLPTWELKAPELKAIQGGAVGLPRSEN